MKKTDKQLIKCLAGFIKWSYLNNKESNWILSNLSHDIIYQAKRDKFYMPRTERYAKYFDGEKI